MDCGEVLAEVPTVRSISRGVERKALRVESPLPTFWPKRLLYVSDPSIKHRSMSFDPSLNLNYPASLLFTFSTSTFYSVYLRSKSLPRIHSAPLIVYPRSICFSSSNDYLRRCEFPPRNKLNDFGASADSELTGTA